MPEDNETIELVEITFEPFIYFVPSTWSYLGTNEEDTLDTFQHSTGAEFSVQRLIMSRDPDSIAEPDPASLLLGVNESVEERSAVVRLVGGLTMVSYIAPEEEDPNRVGLYCELCGYFAPGELGVLRYGSLVERADLQTPRVVLWSHVIRQYARLCRFVTDHP